jgi:hypothetical protein
MPADFSKVFMVWQKRMFLLSYYCRIYIMKKDEKILWDARIIPTADIQKR